MAKFGPLHLLVLLAPLMRMACAQATSNSTNTTAIMEQLQQLPECPLQCIMSEISQSTCSLSDFDCVCTNTDLAADLTLCLTGNCTVKESLLTEKFQNTACGVPVRNAGKNLQAIVWTIYAVAFFALLCHLTVRMPWLEGRMAWDDWTLIACMLALTPTSAIAHVMIDKGLGQDIWMLEVDHINNTLFYFYIEEFLYTFMVVFTKISILFLYLRIFPSQRFVVLCYTFIGIVAAFGISCVVSTALYCAPTSYNWEILRAILVLMSISNTVWTQWDGEHVGTCFNINARTYALAGVNITLDVIIFVLPIPQLIPLQLNWKRKVGIILMFIVGLFVTLCSIFRLHTVLQWGKSVNPTYDYTGLTLWCLVEIDAGVVCACMPGMAGLLRRMLPHIFGTTKGNSYQKDGDNSSSSASGRCARSPKMISKTTNISVSYGDASVYAQGHSQTDSKSDEFELIDREVLTGNHLGMYEPGRETRSYRNRW